MLKALLEVIVIVLPWVMEAFGQDAKNRRKDNAFDKALADNDIDSLTCLLSERYDSVRTKDGNRA